MKIIVSIWKFQVHEKHVFNDILKKFSDFSSRKSVTIIKQLVTFFETPILRSFQTRQS